MWGWRGRGKGGGTERTRVVHAQSRVESTSTSFVFLLDVQISSVNVWIGACMVPLRSFWDFPCSNFLLIFQVHNKEGAKKFPFSHKLPMARLSGMSQNGDAECVLNVCSVNSARVMSHTNTLTPRFFQEELNDFHDSRCKDEARQREACLVLRAECFRVQTHNPDPRMGCGMERL